MEAHARARFCKSATKPTHQHNNKMDGQQQLFLYIWFRFEPPMLSVQKVIATPLEKSGLSKKGSVHNLCHSSIKTTMIYTQVSNKAINWIQSQLDRLNLEVKNKSDEKSIITSGD